MYVAHKSIDEFAGIDAISAICSLVIEYPKPDSKNVSFFSLTTTFFIGNEAVFFTVILNLTTSPILKYVLLFV